MRWKTIIFAIVAAGGLLLGCSSPGATPNPLTAKIIAPKRIGFYNPTEFVASLGGTLADTATVKWTVTGGELSNSTVRKPIWQMGALVNDWEEANFTVTLTVSHPDVPDIHLSHDFAVEFCSTGSKDNRQDPCGLENIYQVAGINRDLSGHYMLLRDIDASATYTAEWNDEMNELHFGSGFRPLGGGGGVVIEFTGTFDGAGHTISDLIGTWGLHDYVGIFAKIEGPSVVKNLSLDRIEFIGGDGVGAIAGHNAGTIESVRVSYAQILGNQSVGGIAGINTADIIDTEVYISGVTGSSNYVGGIAGKSGGTISDSSVSLAGISGGVYTGGVAGSSCQGIFNASVSEITVSGTERVGGVVGGTVEGGPLQVIRVFDTGVYGNSFVGGIAGEATGPLIYGRIIESGVVFNTDFGNCNPGDLTVGTAFGGVIGYALGGTTKESYALETLVKACNHVGGFVGELANGQIFDSYAMRGEVTSTPNRHYHGGFAGFIRDGGKVARAFALMSGDVSFFGAAPLDQDAYQQFFWSTDYPGASQNIALADGSHEISKADFAKVTTFTTGGIAWDFATTWQMGSGIFQFANTLPDLRNNPR